jgi:hypothetical protein
MPLVFSYRPLAAPAPSWPLRGRRERPRPLLYVSLIGPSDTRVRLALLDTGADDTVFPAALAAVVGVDLTNAPSGGGAGVGRVAAALRYAEVRLRITDGLERREWPARIGFTAAPIQQPLLGFAGFLQFFTARFHGELEKVELTINSLYPGV